MTCSVHYFQEVLVYSYALVYKALPNPFGPDCLPSPRGEDRADKAIPCQEPGRPGCTLQEFDPPRVTGMVQTSLKASGPVPRPVPDQPSYLRRLWTEGPDARLEGVRGGEDVWTGQDRATRPAVAILREGRVD